MSQVNHHVFGVVRLAPGKTTGFDNQQIPLIEQFRLGFVPPNNRTANLVSDGCVAYCARLLECNKSIIGSRWPIVLWDTSAGQYIDLKNSSVMHEAFSSLWGEHTYPASDDCTLLWNPEKGLKLFSSSAGAARWYYHQKGQSLYFSDHLPLLAAASRASADVLGVGELLRFGSNNTHRTVLSDFSQVPYGHVLFSSSNGSYDVAPFLDLNPRPEIHLQFDDVVDLAEKELVRSMQALGRSGEVIVSGGIDSALLSLFGSRAGVVRDGWFLAMNADDPETRWAQMVCQISGIKFHRKQLDPSWEALIETIRAYGYPSLDFSVLPTYQIGKFAQRNSQADLILDGTGGDAWFGFKSLAHAQWWKRLSHLQPGVQKIASSLYRHLIAMDRADPVRVVRIGARSSVLGHAGLGHMCTNPAYRHFINLSDSQWKELEISTVTVAKGLVGGSDLSSQDEMLIVDAAMIAINQFASKSGHWSLSKNSQTLYPFLMPNMVQLALRVPNSMKMNKQGAKLILKEMAVRTRLGRTFALRKKVGFQPPLEQFLNSTTSAGPLAALLYENDEITEILRPRVIPLIEKILARPSPYTVSNRFMLWALIYLKLWFRSLREGTLH